MRVKLRHRFALIGMFYCLVSLNNYCLAQIKATAKVLTYETGTIVDNSVIGPIFIDSSGTVFVGSLRGVSLYKSGKWKKYGFPVPRRPKLTLGPRDIKVDAQDRAWFAGRHGLVRIGNKGSFVAFNPKVPFDPSYFCFGENDSSWLLKSVSSKLWHCKGNEWKVVFMRDRCGGLLSEQLVGLEVDSSGVLWIGSFSHGVPAEPNIKWSHKGENWFRAPVAPLYSFDGKIWRAYQSKVFGMSMKGCLPILANNGKVYIDSLDVGIFKQKGTKWELVAKNPWTTGVHLFLGREDRVWAVEDGVLYLVGPGDVKPIAVKIESKGSSTINLRLPKCIVEGPDNTLWIGTYWGLVKLKFHGHEKAK